MSNIAENIKNYFSSKDSGDKETKNPEGMCPNCWGHNEWDGKYYEIKKDKHTLPNAENYDSFISKIVAEHVDKTNLRDNKYICVSCDKDID